PTGHDQDFPGPRTGPACRPLVRGTGHLDGGGRELQQVMAQSFIGAEPVDPRHLPAPLHTLRRSALVSVSHAWVLHRRLVVRVAGAILALLLSVGAYEARGVLALGANAVAKMEQGEFVAAGFGINQITISGQSLTRDSDIVTLMAISAGNSTLDFDVNKA